MIERFFAEIPPRRRRAVELAVFAYATVWLVVRSPYVLDTAALPARRFEAIGVWAWLDEPLPQWFVAAALVVAVIACAAVALGRGRAVAAPVGALATLAVVTYTNCWEQVFHTENLMVLHLGILGFAAVATPDDREGWPLRFMTLVTVAAYVLAGWAKLDIAGSEWLTGDVLRNQVAYDNLRKILLGDVHSPIGGWLVGVGWIWTPIALATLAVELGAPVVLLGGRIRLAWIGAAWLFHLGILATMAILFPYQLTGVAFVSMLPAERALSRLSRRAPSPRPAPR